MIISIPYEIPSQNHTNRSHWSAKSRDVATVARYVNIFGWKYCDAKGPRSLHILSYRRRLCTDRGNLIGGAKQMIDGIVRAGALVDDSDDLATITYEQRVLSQMPDDLAEKFQRKPCTVLTFADLPTLSEIL